MKKTDYSDWTKFDALEYANRNYLKGVLPEDKDIIEFAAKYLEKNCRKKTLNKIADVGAGPNLYPTLVAAPFASPNSAIELIEPVKNNREFLQKSIDNLKSWGTFEDLLNSHSPTTYPNAPSLPNSIKIVDGDIYQLNHEKYDLVMSFFVAESITNNSNKVRRAMDSLKASVKPGGLLITAHMLGSHGYFAGILTSFPATPIAKDDLESYYSDFIDVEMKLTSHNEDYEPRKGYKGMAVVCGRKPK